MSVVRKVQPRLDQKKEAAPAEQPRVAQKTHSASKEVALKKAGTTKRVCFFCKHKIEPGYWDAMNLRKFTNDRGRIYPRQRSGSCAKHQRRLSREIKHARHLALLPFIIRV